MPTTQLLPICRFSGFAVSIIILLQQWCDSADLPFQSPDYLQLEHMLDQDVTPVRPDPQAIRAKVKKLPSSFLPQPEWVPPGHGLGTVTAVAFDPSGNVVIFHRADRVWNQHTFNANNNVYTGSQTPIGNATIIAYNRRTGMEAYRIGSGLFYMPHGLTIDAAGDIYVTDVGLHQVMKLRRVESSERSHIEWTLGKKFRPGRTNDTFCKPTAVAVLPNGDFFVADGYCNSRIIKYSAAVQKMLEWGVNSFAGPTLAQAPAPPNFFAIPHALTLAPDRKWLCVADREHGRVQCFDENGVFQRQYHSPLMGDRLFSVAYAPVMGGRLYVVNGPDNGLVKWDDVSGFVVDVQSGEVLSKFSPVSRSRNESFLDPHDVIVSEDGLELYVADLQNMVFKLISAESDLYNKTLNIHTYAASNATATTTTPRHETDATPRMQRSQWILVAALSSLVVCLIVLLGYYVVRRRRRENGCCCCLGTNTPRRRHAWDLTGSAAETLRLGHFLDGKGDFEPVNQDASDEESNGTTNGISTSMLT